MNAIAAEQFKCSKRVRATGSGLKFVCLRLFGAFELQEWLSVVSVLSPAASGFELVSFLLGVSHAPHLKPKRGIVNSPSYPS
jgi:hypothetical protein